jgi:inhibitor of cysteine peptidase
VKRASRTRRLLETAIVAIVCGCIGYALLSAVEDSLASSSAAVTVSDADNGKTVRLDPGDTLIVSLESNPSTGYVWQVARVDASVLAPSGQPVYRPGEQMPGAPGRQLFKFNAQKSGSAALKIIYVRPWEKGAAPGKTWEVNVAIK